MDADPHILFPDGNPPPFPGRANLHDGFAWVLGVMDLDDSARPFVASVYTHFLKYGSVSERQMSALQKVLQRISGLFQEGSLHCQGGQKSGGAAEFVVGEVIRFPRLSGTLDDGEVVE